MTDTADRRPAVRAGAGAAPLRVHRLSDPAFAALGAGRPDPATIAELRRAQLSRHLLLLSSLRHRLRTKKPS